MPNLPNRVLRPTAPARLTLSKRNLPTAVPARHKLLQARRVNPLRPRTRSRSNDLREPDQLHRLGRRAGSGTNEYANEFFGSTKENFESLRRFIFTQGYYSPTNADGLPPFNFSTDRNATRNVLVDGIGHIADLASEAWEPKGVSWNLDSVRTFVIPMYIPNEYSNRFEIRNCNTSKIKQASCSKHDSCYRGTRQHQLFPRTLRPAAKPKGVGKF